MKPLVKVTSAGAMWAGCVGSACQLRPLVSLPTGAIAFGSMGEQRDQADIGRFAVLLRQLREARGLTQKQLARASGISERAIQDLESGRSRNPQFHTVTHLAEALNATPWEREALTAAARPNRTPKAHDEGEFSETTSWRPAPLPPMLIPDETRSESQGTQAIRAQAPNPHLSAGSAATGAPVSPVAIAAVAVVAIVAAAFGLSVAWSPSSTGQEATSSPAAGQEADLVTITAPADQASVPGTLDVHGTARLPSQTELWLLVQPQHGDPSYVAATPQALPIDSSGAWVARITIGRGPQDAGQAFRLVAVVSPTDGSIQRHVKLLPKGK